MILARLALAYVVIFSYPVVAYLVPLRSLLHAIGLCGAEAADSGADRRGGEARVGGLIEPPQESVLVSEPLTIALRLLTLVVTCIVALRVSELGLIVSLVGALVGGGILFVVCPLCHLRVVPSGEPHHGLMRVCAYGLLALGLVLWPLMVAQTLGVIP